MGDLPRPLILASASPRRRELLQEAGFSFTVRPPDIDESAQPGESVADCARRLAREKALRVRETSPTDCCVLAADTIVVLDDRALGKPRDAEEAQTMLRSLAGRAHRVLTGWALATPEELIDGVVESRVEMRAISAEEARAYADSGEPLDKAGAYAIQGDGGRFVTRLEGSRSNVIGLPLEVVVPLLEQSGVARK